MYNLGFTPVFFSTMQIAQFLIIATSFSSCEADNKVDYPRVQIRAPPGAAELKETHKHEVIVLHVRAENMIRVPNALRNRLVASSQIGTCSVPVGHNNSSSGCESGVRVLPRLSVHPYTRPSAHSPRLRRSLTLL